MHRGQTCLAGTDREIAHYPHPAGSQHRLRMELRAVHVVFPVAQGHDFAVAVQGRHLQTGGETLAVHCPRVVASHLNLWLQAAEQAVVAQQPRRGLHAVVHFLQVAQPCAERLGNGLVPQAHAEHALAGSVCPDERQQQSRLAGDAWPGREDDFVEPFHLFQGDFVVAAHFHVRIAQFLHHVQQVVGKGVVIVEKQYLH